MVPPEWKKLKTGLGKGYSVRVEKVVKEGMEVEGSVRGDQWKSVKTWMSGRK